MFLSFVMIRYNDEEVIVNSQGIHNLIVLRYSQDSGEQEIKVVRWDKLTKNAQDRIPHGEEAYNLGWG